MPEKAKATSDPFPHLARRSFYADAAHETKSRPSETENAAPETEIRKAETIIRLTPRRGRGRPKSETSKPWEAAGMSRAAWYRQKTGEP